MNIPRCPVCASQATEMFLRRQGVPVLQNMVVPTQEEAVGAARGDLGIVCYAVCGFVFNAAFEPALIHYDADYDNTQTCSGTFARHVQDLVAHLVDDKGVRGCRIVEVGCGQGAFLRLLVEPPGWNNRGWGFDPADRGPDSDLDGRLHFERALYQPEHASLQADVVTCRHVIEHIQHPVDLLRTIRQALDAADDARVFFETPCVEWILRNRVIWDFFYEHCSYFSTASMSRAFEEAGFRVESVRHIFGGQYLWLEATPQLASESSSASAGSEEQSAAGMATSALAREFAQCEAEMVAQMRERVRTLASSGRLALWGAGAKGVTLANLTDPERKYFDCVVDINPAKQNHFLPGTGHAVVEEAQVEARGISTVVLTNPNYLEEITRSLCTSGGGSDCAVVNLMGASIS
jgi:hypothetical protein